MIDKNKVTDFFAMLGINEENIDFQEENEISIINISAPEELKGILIGRHARTLDDLQRIVSLMINNEKEDHQRILLDIDSYRKDRLEKIIAKADELASAVKETGTPKPLPRLSPTERRQVHIHFSEDDSISTYSQGEGSERRLFISPATE